MSAQELQLWITVVSAAIDLGGRVYAHIKAAMSEAGLTDVEINAIEAAGNAESQRRRDEREAMIGGA